jgi:hypothetical protein
MATALYYFTAQHMYARFEKILCTSTEDNIMVFRFHNIDAALLKEKFGDQFFHSSLPGGCSPPGSRTVFDEMNYG